MTARADSLTGEQIEKWSKYFVDRYRHPIEDKIAREELGTLCDMALRSLTPPSSNFVPFDTPIETLVAAAPSATAPNPVAGWTFHPSDDKPRTQFWGKVKDADGLFVAYIGEHHARAMLAAAPPTPQAGQEAVAWTDGVTEAMSDSVRGVLQILRGKPGATFKDVRCHCSNRGDDLSRWPRWIADAEGYVTEEAAATMLWQIMRTHAAPVSAPVPEEREHPDSARLDGLDKLTNEGYCPALLFDDNGHWAVVDEGHQNVPMGEGPEDIETSHFVQADKWKPTIREAIDAYLGEFMNKRGIPE
jgi:hypothetical protein